MLFPSSQKVCFCALGYLFSAASLRIPWVARGRFQPNQDALGWHRKVAEGRVHLQEARVAIGHCGGLDDGALVGLQDRVDTGLTAHINAHHRGKAGRIQRRGEDIG